MGRPDAVQLHQRNALDYFALNLTLFLLDRLIADDPVQHESTPGAARYEDASSSDSKRVPIDTLARLFPQIKRNILRSALDRCDGDVLKAIEQLIYHNNNPESERSTPPSAQKRKTSEPAANNREKMRYQPQQLPDQQPSFPWKIPLGNSPFPVPNSPVGSSSTRPLFPLQSSYFPAFGYNTPSFLTSSFLRPDYPVFPGMSLLSGAAGSAPPQSPLESMSPYVTAYGHPSAGPSILHHHSSPPNVKQEPDINILNENHSSPRSDRSAERSPYSD